MFCSDFRKNSETKNRGTKTLIEYHLAPPRVWSYKSKINVKQLLTKLWKILGNESSVTKAELSFITIVNEILKDCVTRRWEVKCDKNELQYVGWRSGARQGSSTCHPPSRLDLERDLLFPDLAGRPFGPRQGHADHVDGHQGHAHHRLDLSLHCAQFRFSGKNSIFYNLKK